MLDNNQIITSDLNCNQHYHLKMTLDEKKKSHLSQQKGVILYDTICYDRLLGVNK